MERLETAAELQALRARWQQAGERVGFVPTMGALHAGHLSLVERARAGSDRVVVSVFVNPLQFGPQEDFARYPRDPEGDRRLLAAAGVDACYFAREDDMYRSGHCTYVVQEGCALATDLEARHRPGHFRGVLTVVLKLLQRVKPHRAWFGQKDYQQLLAVRRMVDDLDLGVGIEMGPTVRDTDGLALSSRNAYLSAQERAAALAIPRALEAARERWRQGERSPARLQAALREALAAEPRLAVDYAEVRDAATLEPAAPGMASLVALVAARAGRTRLLDNALLGQGEH